MNFFYKRRTNKAKIIIILLFLASLNQINSDLPNISILENKYPICFKMNNGNFLILNEKGLYVTDSSFSSIINAYNFTSSLSDQEFKKVGISQFPKDDGENILVFVKISIYFLSKEGTYINNFDLSSNNIITTDRYQLLVNKKFSDYLHYAIFYFCSQQITIYNFNIKNDGSENILTIVQSFKPTLASYPNLSLKDNELACNYMNSDEYGKVTLCFLGSDSPEGIITSAFDPNNNFTEINEKIPIKFLSSPGKNILKSVANNKLKKTIIGYLNNSMKGCYLVYDIDSKNFITTDEDISYERNICMNYCANDYLKSHIYFFKETQEFVFTCSNSNAGFTLVQFSNDAVAYSDTPATENFSLENCYSYNSFSLLCLEKEKQYSIFLDPKCGSNNNFIGERRNISNDNLINKPDFNNTTTDDIVEKTEKEIEEIIEDEEKEEHLENEEYEEKMEQNKEEKEYMENEVKEGKDEFIEEEEIVKESEEEIVVEIIKKNYTLNIENIKNIEINFLDNSDLLIYYKSSGNSINVSNSNIIISYGKILGNLFWTNGNSNEKLDSNISKPGLYKIIYSPSSDNFKYNDKINIVVKNNNNKIISNKATYNFFICQQNCTCNDYLNYCESCISNYSNYLNKSNCKLTAELNINIYPYFIDSNYIYQDCYFKCKTCSEYYNEIENNMYCNSCYIEKGYYLDGSNCKESIDCGNNNYYIDKKTLNKICLNNNVCPKDYKYEITKTKECTDVGNCEDMISGDVKTSSYALEETYDLIKNEIKSGVLNSSISEGKDTTIYGYNITIQITNTKNQKENDYNNISTIDLGECENKLKKEYNISENVPLLIYKIDIKRNDTISTEVEYEVYDSITLKKLDLSYCKGITINIYSPVDMDDIMRNNYENAKNQGYDIYNANDSFFNDICTQYNSNSSTDVTLSDRQENYFENISLCESNCNYKEINITNNKVHCECGVKEEVNTNVSKDTFNIASLVSNIFQSYGSFKLNFEIVSCFKLIFSAQGMKRNYCSLILSILTIINIILLLINFNEGLNKIKLYIAEIIFKKIIIPDNLKFDTFKQAKIENNKNDNNIISANLRKNSVSNIAINNNLFINKNTKRNSIVINNKNNNVVVSKFKQRKSVCLPLKSLKNFPLAPPKRKIVDQEKNISINNEEIKEYLPPTRKSIKFTVDSPNIEYSSSRGKIKTLESNVLIANKTNKNKIHKEKIAYHEMNKNVENISKKDLKQQTQTRNKDRRAYVNSDKFNLNENTINQYIDEELNNMSYKEAIIEDNRNYFQYYISLIRTKHLIFFTFCNYRDYNILLLKISLFLTLICLYFFINALFYNDSTIHEIYKDQGKFNFLYQLPKTIYSSIISIVISFILKRLALFQKDILNLKKQSDKKLHFHNVIKCYKIKISIYFIINLFCSIFFWYYLAAFGAVYRNTQISLITSTIMSYGLSLLYPFGIYLIPGIFRIPAIKSTKKDKECFYKIGQLIALF